MSTEPSTLVKNPGEGVPTRTSVPTQRMRKSARVARLHQAGPLAKLKPSSTISTNNLGRRIKAMIEKGGVQAVTNLLDSLAVREITFANRVFVSPMSDYWSIDGD